MIAEMFHRLHDQKLISAWLAAMPTFAVRRMMRYNRLANLSWPLRAIDGHDWVINTRLIWSEGCPDCRELLGKDL